MAIRQHVGALFTDLYEVTMAQAYWAERMSGTAVFEIFFRKLPPGRSYIMAAGLADVVEFLEAFRFDEQDLRYLRGLGQFSDEFLRWLAGVRFTGDVWAAPEGTVIFPNEPAVQLIAPIIEAQLVETFVLNQIHLQSVLASKAARVIRGLAWKYGTMLSSRTSRVDRALMPVLRLARVVGPAHRRAETRAAARLRRPHSR